MAGQLGAPRPPDDEPAPNRLTPYPVPFRHALTAIAPQPGAPVGALSSEALAVGDDGEVARYQPGRGLAAGKPARAPAGRSETDRACEPSPGPRPTAPTRSVRLGPDVAVAGGNRAVGTGPGDAGELPRQPARDRLRPLQPKSRLRRGPAGGAAALRQDVDPGRNCRRKSPGASFTSIAFAGSEAIVAYRKVHLETATAKATTTPAACSSTKARAGTSTRAPRRRSVATCRGRSPACPTAAQPSRRRRAVSVAPLILERESGGAPWLATPPYPGRRSSRLAGSFREGGALRGVGSGGVPATIQFEDERPPPAGFPPNLIEPYPLGDGLRHPSDRVRLERRGARTQRRPRPARRIQSLRHGLPAGSDLRRPDRPHGHAGLGRGGRRRRRRQRARSTRPTSIATRPTAYRRRASAQRRCRRSSSEEPRSRSPAGRSARPRVPPAPTRASAPTCGSPRRSNRRGSIAGVRAFLYTGRVSPAAKATALYRALRARVRALRRTALRSSLPAFPVPSPTDRGPGSECEFQEAFAGFPAPFGGAPARSRSRARPTTRWNRVAPGDTCA